ncbi:hypothetical protein MTR_8g041490 [Medicago truncatula]|uniref:Uncharacterized protein n=1 Tax=Medicago truncatula TaxID=3880 RepID=G7LID8_MEDTR|nr:hypothetical protein MTR_8g041490 [Medicago truncatula]
MEISPMTNVEVSKHILDDIAFYVQSKLPIKSLKRFGCTRPFLLSRYVSSPKSGRGQEHVFYFLSGERFESRVKLDWPKVDGNERQPIQEDNDDPPYDLDEDASCFES